MGEGQDWRTRAGSLSVCGQAFIGGKYVSAMSGTEFKNFSPIDGRSLGTITDCGDEDLDEAVKHASRSFLAGSWQWSSRAEKRRVLHGIAEQILAHRDELALLETLDTGKPIADSLKVDIPLSAACFDWYAEIVDKRYDEMISTASSNMVAICREPLGVIGAIVPWNFPLLMAAWKVAPALAMGNSVVLKPSELSPLTAIKLGEFASAAGLPDGVLNVCPGRGVPAGRALGLHPQVAAVTFTGSVEVGKQLLIYAGESNMKRVWIESGGNNAQVVLSDTADLESAANAVAWGAFYNQGEMCSAGRRLIVQSSIREQLLEKVVALAAELQPSDPLDARTKNGALISADHLMSVAAHVRKAILQGGKVISGGSECNVVPGGNYFCPTVIDSVTPKHEIFSHEVFGPVLTVTSAETPAEALSIANQTDYGLTASVWSQNVDRAFGIARRIRAGTVWVNCYDRSDFSVPFGGFGASGFGRAKSLHALEKYSDLKAIWLEHKEIPSL